MFSYISHSFIKTGTILFFPERKFISALDFLCQAVKIGIRDFESSFSSSVSA